MVLAGPKKKCLEDTIAEDTIAIAHDDDLRLVKDAVGPSQNAENHFGTQRRHVGIPDCRCDREVLT